MEREKKERGDGRERDGRGREECISETKFVRRTRGRDDVVNPVGGVACHRPSGVARCIGESANACVGSCGGAVGRKEVVSGRISECAARCGCG